MERYHVISLQWAPLVVVFAWSYLEFGNQIVLTALAGFLYLQILTSLHAGLFTLMIVVIYLATLAILGRKQIQWRRLGGSLLRSYWRPLRSCQSPCITPRISRWRPIPIT